MEKELYIGLDVHREAVAIAVAEQGRKGEVRDYRQISNDLHALEKFITRLRQTHGKRVTLRACNRPCERETGADQSSDRNSAWHRSN
jgi:hypothetical protein